MGCTSIPNFAEKPDLDDFLSPLSKRHFGPGFDRASRISAVTRWVMVFAFDAFSFAARELIVEPLNQVQPWVFRRSSSNGGDRLSHGTLRL
jgi:hypothetical protein